MKITLRQLQIFVEIAKSGNVSQAADAVAISQSAASMSLAQLESLLDQTLFSREGKRLVLNDVGRAWLPKADALLQQAQSLEKSVHQPDSVFGHLRIAASTTIADYVLPSLMNDFQQQYPDVSIDLMSENTGACVEDLLALKADVALVEGLVTHKGIKLIPWQDDELMVCCHPGHPLGKRKTVNEKELVKYPWVSRENNSGTRRMFETVLPDVAQSRDVILTMNSSSAIKNYLQHNQKSLACLSEQVVAQELNAKQLISLKIKDHTLQRQFYWVDYQAKMLSTAGQCFKDFIMG